MEVHAEARRRRTRISPQKNGGNAKITEISGTTLVSPTSSSLQKNPHNERPLNRRSPIAPNLSEGQPELLRDIFAGALPIITDRRPRAQVGQIIIKVPLGGRFKSWTRDFTKRRAYRTVTFMQNTAPLRPRGRNHRLEIFQHAINPGINYRPIVAPESHDTAHFQNPHHFRPETREIKPMQRLSNCDQINRARLKAGFFSGRRAIGNARLRRRQSQKLLTNIGRNHLRKRPGQTQRRLTRASRAVPRKIMFFALRIQETI